MSKTSRQLFWTRLHQLGFQTYEAYLLSPHWADLRQRYLASKLHKGRCFSCRQKVSIELHHRTYVRLGNEHLGDMVAFCHSCHQKVHDREKALGQPLQRATKRVIHQAWASLSRQSQHAGGQRRAQGRRPPLQGG